MGYGTSKTAGEEDPIGDPHRTHTDSSNVFPMSALPQWVKGALQLLSKRHK